MNLDQLTPEFIKKLQSHISTQQKLNDMMHEALSKIAISTTQDGTRIAREALWNYSKIYMEGQR